MNLKQVVLHEVVVLLDTEPHSPESARDWHAYVGRETSTPQCQLITAEQEHTANSTIPRAQANENFAAVIDIG